MSRWLRRFALLALAGAGIRWLVNGRARHDQARSGVASSIGGDTWPPVPVNPVNPVNNG